MLETIDVATIPTEQLSANVSSCFLVPEARKAATSGGCGSMQEKENRPISRNISRVDSLGKAKGFLWICLAPPQTLLVTVGGMKLTPLIPLTQLCYRESRTRLNRLNTKEFEKFDSETRSTARGAVNIEHQGQQVLVRFGRVSGPIGWEVV
jgi:hypothetical protein